MLPRHVNEIARRVHHHLAGQNLARSGRLHDAVRPIDMPADDFDPLAFLDQHFARMQANAHLRSRREDGGTRPCRIGSIQDALNLQRSIHCHRCIIEYREDRIPAKLQHLSEAVACNDDFLKCEHAVGHTGRFQIPESACQRGKARDIGKENGDVPQTRAETFPGV